MTIEFIKDKLELLGYDHPLVDQIEEEIYELDSNGNGLILQEEDLNQEDLIEMSNRIDVAIKELNR